MKPYKLPWSAEKWVVAILLAVAVAIVLSVMASIYVPFSSQKCCSCDEIKQLCED